MTSLGLPVGWLFVELCGMTSTFCVARPISWPLCVRTSRIAVQGAPRLDWVPGGLGW